MEPALSTIDCSWKGLAGVNLLIEPHASVDILSHRKFTTACDGIRAGAGTIEETEIFRDVKRCVTTGNRTQARSQELASCATTAYPPQHNTTGSYHRAFDVFQDSCYTVLPSARRHSRASRRIILPKRKRLVVVVVTYRPNTWMIIPTWLRLRMLSQDILPLTSAFLVTLMPNTLPGSAIKSQMVLGGPSNSLQTLSTWSRLLVNRPTTLLRAILLFLISSSQTDTSVRPQPVFSCLLLTTSQLL